MNNTNACLLPSTTGAALPRWSPRLPAAWARLTSTALLFLASAQVLAAGLASPQVVYPTGTYPLDVENVQTAVTRGGTVILKATNAAGAPTDFDFGPNTGRMGGIVWLTTDVQVIGESVATRMATIHGGRIPFVGDGPARMKIQGVRFEAPENSAIIILFSTGLEIIGNRIAHAAGTPLSWGVTEGRGIKLVGILDPATAITGNALIANNVIEDMPADLSEAIVLDRVAADVEIRGNRIRNVHGGGIVINRGQGATRIHDNSIEPGPGNGTSWGDGIDIVGSHGGTYRVFDNAIHCENPLADGIWVGGLTLADAVEQPVIERNQITMRGAYGAAIAFDGAVSGALVRQNLVDGEALFAIRLNDSPIAPGIPADGNVFAGNEISRFRSYVADVILDRNTRDNAIAGYSGRVIDLGLANRITGFSPVSGGAFGQQVKDALALKRETTTSRMHAGELPR